MQDTLLAVFTGILAVAVLMQTLIFFGIFKAFRKLADRMEGLSREVQKNVETVTAKADETLTVIRDFGAGLEPVRERLVGAADIVHNRIEKMDDFLEETTDTARAEILRVKSGIESASNRVEEVLDLMQNCVMVPFNEITAITRGIHAAFDLLFRRRRRRVSNDPDEEEEMFI